MEKKREMKTNNQETERFIDLARKLVHVPKKDVDERIEAERQAKARARDTKRKA